MAPVTYSSVQDRFKARISVMAAKEMCEAIGKCDEMRYVPLNADR